MNSVSRPSRPTSRARSASRAMSVVSKGLLPALRLPRRAHADGFIQPRGAAVGPVYGKLGRAQPSAAEGREQRQQQGASVSTSTRARGDAELGDVADAVLPALAERGAGKALAVVQQ